MKYCCSKRRDVHMPDRIDLEQYYTAKEAAEVLSRNSGKDIDAAYVRMLSKYKKLIPKKINTRLNLYPKAQVDGYVVEDRGVKSALAAKKRAEGEKRKRERKAAKEIQEPAA
jgi:hypothetical protein